MTVESAAMHGTVQTIATHAQFRTLVGTTHENGTVSTRPVAEHGDRLFELCMRRHDVLLHFAVLSGERAGRQNKVLPFDRTQDRLKACA